MDNTLVTAVTDLFRTYPDIPAYILPGNHDPHTGPDSIWQRRPLMEGPPNVHILREAGAIELADNIFLVASPLHQKISTTDPSLKIAELTAPLPPDAIKIGVTHGALAIESKHQPNDFPIALNAATRAGLDYLAIGHWHNWLEGIDEGRILMPGTPEPDRFANDASGRVALVEISAHGQPLRIEPLSVATLTWRTLDYDFLAPDASRASATAALAELAPSATRTVLRVCLHGAASPAALAETHTWLEAALTPFPFNQIVDETRIALTAAELADLQTRHPILTQVLADIDRLENLATGTTPANTTPAPPPADPSSLPLHDAQAACASTSPNTPHPTTSLTLADAQALLAPSRIDLAQLTPTFFTQLRQTLLQTLQEETAQ